MTPEQARANLAVLETNVGAHLANLPVDQRDQWIAHMRDMLGALGVDIANPGQATAAFAGAYMAATLLLPVAHLPKTHVQIALYMLRHLADRADERPLEPAQFWPWWT